MKIIQKIIFLLAVLNLANCSNDKTANSGGFSCYFLGNLPDRNYWISTYEAFGGYYTKLDCYRLDSCSGGLGLSNGGCYKWARNVDDIGEKWDNTK